MECDDFVVRKTLSYFKKNIKSESQETNSIITNARFAVRTHLAIAYRMQKYNAKNKKALVPLQHNECVCFSYSLVLCAMITMELFILLG